MCSGYVEWRMTVGANVFCDFTRYLRSHVEMFFICEIVYDVNLLRPMCVTSVHDRFHMKNICVLAYTVGFA